MPAIKTSDLKGGSKVLLDGAPCSVITSEHIQPGKGQAFVRIGYRNLLTGKTLEKTCRSGETLEMADVVECALQYLYNDGTFWHFMDPQSYEQYPINRKSVEHARKWLSEQDVCTVILWNGEAIGVTPPNFVTLEVTHTEPGMKGDTTGAATKPATLSTGANIAIPLFVQQGDFLKIDTRTGEYVSRVTK